MMHMSQDTSWVGTKPLPRDSEYRALLEDEKEEVHYDWCLSKYEMVKIFNEARTDYEACKKIRDRMGLRVENRKWVAP